MAGVTCEGCVRWNRQPPKHGKVSRMGMCTARAMGGLAPYWHGVITTFDFLLTADVHGDGCAAHRARKSRPVGGTGRLRTLR